MIFVARFCTQGRAHRTRIFNNGSNKTAENRTKVSRKHTTSLQTPQSVETLACFPANSANVQIPFKIRLDRYSKEFG